MVETKGIFILKRIYIGGIGGTSSLIGIGFNLLPKAGLDFEHVQLLLIILNNWTCPKLVLDMSIVSNSHCLLDMSKFILRVLDMFWTCPKLSKTHPKHFLLLYQFWLNHNL